MIRRLVRGSSDRRDVSVRTHYYVWYTVEGERAAAIRAVSELISAIESQTGIAGRVLARRDDPTTWMEIYENVDDIDFERTLRELAARHGVLPFVAGGRRHVERFAALRDALGPDAD